MGPEVGDDLPATRWLRHVDLFTGPRILCLPSGKETTTTAAAPKGRSGGVCVVVLFPFHLFQIGLVRFFLAGASWVIKVSSWVITNILIHECSLITLVPKRSPVIQPFHR